LSTDNFGDHPGSGGIVYFLRVRCGFFPEENGEFSPLDRVTASTYAWRYTFYSIFITYPFIKTKQLSVMEYLNCPFCRVDAEKLVIDQE